MKKIFQYKSLIKKIMSGAFLFYLLKGIMWLVVLYFFPTLFNKIFGE